jgi:hypothetical protein
MSNDLINNITLNYLVNKDLCIRTTTTTKKTNKEDRKFYRKRIYGLVQDILTSREKRASMSPDVLLAFDIFMNAGVNYFKILDTTDIIQEDYKGIIDTSLSEIDDCEQTVENANKGMMRAIQMNNSLDNFITKKVTNKRILLLPQQRDIDLKDPSLKNKGIQKKNITNTYDETKNKTDETKNKKTETSADIKETGAND